MKKQDSGFRRQDSGGAAVAGREWRVNRSRAEISALEVLPES
jgi:hypothetical protein